MWILCSIISHDAILFDRDGASLSLNLIFTAKSIKILLIFANFLNWLHIDRIVQNNDVFYWDLVNVIQSLCATHELWLDWFADRRQFLILPYRNLDDRNLLSQKCCRGQLSVNVSLSRRQFRLLIKHGFVQTIVNRSLKGKLVRVLLLDLVPRQSLPGLSNKRVQGQHFGLIAVLGYLFPYFHWLIIHGRKLLRLLVYILVRPI